MMEILTSSIMLGGVYALFAMGLSLMFGVMRLTHISHGDIVVLSGFILWFWWQSGVPLSLALILSLILVGILGFLLQKYILNDVLGNDPLPSLVCTFGLSIIIQNLLLEAFTSNPRSVEVAELSTQTWQIGESWSVGILPLMIFLVALLVTFVLQWIFHATRLGRAFRAVSDDPEIAAIMGLSSRKIYAWATSLAFIVVGIAGALQIVRTTVSPTDGNFYLLYSFEVVIMGGMGSFWGTFAAAMLLGLVQQIGFRIDPGWGIWGGHLFFLLFLLYRPSGMFPKTVS
ncbi:MAG: branched-chain amino acid ABC transporter permease [Gammaproteobacteria bacterium]|nr:branched-chain amino acid ABC transporter permease [Gammaproteobacteria bacterium]